MGWFWYDMDNSPQLPCAMTPAWSAPVPGSCRPWPVPSPGRAPARPCTACSCGGCGGTSSGTAPQSVPVKRGSSGRWRLVSGPWWQKIWIVWPWKINIVKTQVCWDIRGDYRETYLLISGFLTSTRGVGETFFPIGDDHLGFGWDTGNKGGLCKMSCMGLNHQRVPPLHWL